MKKKYKQTEEIVLGQTNKIIVPEIKVRFNRSMSKNFKGQIKSSLDAANFIRGLFPKGELEFQEQFIILYLDYSNRILGYYRHSKGGITSTVVDVRIVLSVALKAGATQFIMAHNHPSGNLKASEHDKKITEKFKVAAKLMDIALLDHLIITKDKYLSFGEEGLLGINTLKNTHNNSIKSYINKIINNDVMSALKLLPDESIDCVITSPPYWQLRDYGWKGQWGLEKTFDEYLEHLWNFMREIHRVIKPKGTVWINLGDSYGTQSGSGRGKKFISKSTIHHVGNGSNLLKGNTPHKSQLLLPHRFAIGCMERGWIVRNDIVWAKKNSMPESVKDRFAKKHEYIFLMVKNKDYYFDLDSIRDPHKEASLKRVQGKWNGHREKGSAHEKMNINKMCHIKGKNPGDISDFWAIKNKASKEKHYAKFHTDLITKPILAGCPKGGIILDPFCGTGTTGVKAIELGRKFIGIEGKKEYCRIAEKNIKQISLEGIPTIREINNKNFTEHIEYALRKNEKLNKKSVEVIAASFNIRDKTEIKELTELAIVNVARELAHSKNSIENRFNKIVDLYNSQVILSHRTSQSILLQQYSTPAPIAYLMGVFCELEHLKDNDAFAFEPSAGNGLLTIAGEPDRIFVNEIDYLRNRNLHTQGFAYVIQNDATEEFSYLKYFGKFKAVLTNPPFGVLDKPVDYSSFPIKTLDHLMALRALDAMAEDGKAAIIIGGHTKWDNQGRIEKGKNRIFFNYLYRHYHVMDVIQIDGHKLYSRQGTSFHVRLILIDGKKKIPDGVAPVKNSDDYVIKSFNDLFLRVMKSLNNNDQSKKKNIQYWIEQAKKLNAKLENDNSDLGAPYHPASNACVVLNTQVPDSMEFETQKALDRIKTEVGGNMDNFVRHRLKYSSQTELCKALSAEQIDAVAMAIYNIEAREQGMIIGDQTGIGKGRIAAALIRYGVMQGLKPIFITEKANLFSDIYRDLAAIGSEKLKPFIINARETKTDIKDEEGNVIYSALSTSEQNVIFESQKFPAAYDFAVATYTQFNSPDKKPEKPMFLMSISKDNLIIMDEAHNSSGSSNTGEFLQRVVYHTKGVIFLSATFAKRPDNMPIYAMKTAISEANLSKDQLIDAIAKGGVALQEILASQLVAEGQMIRRERSFEGIEVNYITLEQEEQKHKDTADGITEILRDIIGFQSNYIDKRVKELDEIAVAEGKEVNLREGTSQAGVDNIPYFSKVFNVINQMLFSIKAESVADRAIERLKEGKKPVIAFASTMASFIEQMETENGLSVDDGNLINTDFAEVLRRGLSGVMRYTERDINGAPIYKHFDVSELDMDAQIEYRRILNNINTVSTGISISPIDVIIKKIEKAGYKVAEVTGRKISVQLNENGSKGLVLARKKVNTNDAFRQFNNNEIDVLLINQSGSTGASAHAIVTSKVPKEQVKQRVMIVLQAELDISTEVQKRGRINRTGQILQPIYDYMVSAIPAEKRLMMMLQKKLKSLDANTTSNQKQSNKILDVPDFLNKYGDKVVKEYISENPQINEMLGDPLHLKSAKEEDSRSTSSEDAANKVSGRVAVLSTKMQAEFYNEIVERYNDYVDYLKQVGEYDLEVEALDLQAETIESKILIMGKGGESAFGEDSVLEKVSANILRKPFKQTELGKIIDETLSGKSAEEIQHNLLQEFQDFTDKSYHLEMLETEEKYDTLIKDITQEKKIKKILERGDDQESYFKAIQERKNELEATKTKAKENIEKSYKNKKQYLTRILSFFTVGRKLMFPVNTFERGSENVLAISLGVQVDKKKKNPYAPSAIKIKIAIANSTKYLAMPASFDEGISKIIAASYQIQTPGIDKLFEEWEEETRSKTKDRGTRFIITGNLLQAFGEKSGKLVSYTTFGGEVKKGILLPEEWLPSDSGEMKTTVPILKALPVIKSLTYGSAIYASNNIALFKAGEQFRIIVPASRSKGGDIYLEKDILSLLEKGMFEKTSDKMQAFLPEANIEKLLSILQEKFGISVSLNSHQLAMIQANKGKSSNRKKIVLPPSEDEEKQKKLKLLKLRAEALILELKLAA